MANTITITGPTFTNKVGVGMPVVPGLLTQAYFGTGFDNNNANRVPGGPALLPIATPIYSSNFVTTGTLTGTNTAIDTQNPRNAAMLAAGWSWATAARCSIATGSAACFLGDGNAGGNTNFIAMTPPSKSMGYYYGGLKASYTAVSASNSYRFIAATYSGGALGTWIIYDFTDSLLPALTYTVVTNMVTATLSPIIGNAVGAAFPGSLDTSYLMVAQGVLSQVALGNIYASVKTSLARRGITV